MVLVVLLITTALIIFFFTDVFGTSGSEISDIAYSLRNPASELSENQLPYMAENWANPFGGG